MGGTIFLGGQIYTPEFLSTGHVSSTYVERLKGVSLVVRSEADGSLLLESKIQPDTAYQKQQGRKSLS